MLLVDTRDFTILMSRNSCTSTRKGSDRSCSWILNETSPSWHLNLISSIFTSLRYIRTRALHISSYPVCVPNSYMTIDSYSDMPITEIVQTFSFLSIYTTEYAELKREQWWRNFFFRNRISRDEVTDDKNPPFQECGNIEEGSTAVVLS